MKHYLAAFLFSALVAAAPVYGQEFKVGSTVADFSITKMDGSPAQFSNLKGDVTLVMFLSVQCPVSNAYDDQMNALYQDYAAKGVKFIVINANRTEPAAAVQERARQHNFQFAVYKDENNAVADKVRRDSHARDLRDRFRRSHPLSRLDRRFAESREGHHATAASGLGCGSGRQRTSAGGDEGVWLFH
jgi:peroxiredoxin